MSLFLPLVAILGVFVSLLSSLKTEDKRPIRKLANIGALVAIVFILGQCINQKHESKQTEARHKEVMEQFAPLLTFAKARNPSKEDRAALDSLLIEFEELLKWSGKQKRASMAGVVQPGGPSSNPSLVSVFSGLIIHEDQSIRSSAETCLEAIGTPEALKVLENYKKK